MKSNKNRLFLLTAICIILQISPILAQTGGNHTFEFLSLTNSARTAALGGNFAAVYDHDITLAVSNPSLISSQMDKKLALSYVNNYSHVNLGYVAYGRNFNALGSFVGSLQFINYGELKYADETGVRSGKFNAGDYSINLGWGRMLDSLFSIGANLKFLYSGLEAYNSLGLAVDISGSYLPNRNTCVSLLVQNVGRQLTSYTNNGVQALPFELQLGVSRRLSHMPFRFSILLQHLEQWDLTYENSISETGNLSNQTEPTGSFGKFTEKAFRHVVLGGEFIPAKFLSLRIGYNYLRRQEMKIDSHPGTVGFSFGLGVNVSKFSINYSRAAYHLVGSRNYLTITTNLGDWAKK